MNTSTNSYPGGSNNKNVARSAGYEPVKFYGLNPKGVALVTAGPEGGDVEHLKALGVEPDDAFFVDTVQSSAESIKLKYWPKAQSYRISFDDFLTGVLPSTGKGISLINLDFMGGPNDALQSTCNAAQGKLLPGGIVMLTFTTRAIGATIKSMDAMIRGYFPGLNLVRSVGYVPNRKNTLYHGMPMEILVYRNGAVPRVFAPEYVPFRPGTKRGEMVRERQLRARSAGP
jgi:hypothetical protein